eukprot:6202668-Pleurochrysis_carterae.AAC.1
MMLESSWHSTDSWQKIVGKRKHRARSLEYASAPWQHANRQALFLTGAHHIRSGHASTYIYASQTINTVVNRKRNVGILTRKIDGSSYGHI